MPVPTNYIGIAAGIFTGASMLPQLIKTIREKNGEGISAATLSVLMTGLALWIWYGIQKEDWPIIVTNVFSFVINSAIAIMRMVYKHRG